MWLFTTTPGLRLSAMMTGAGVGLILDQHVLPRWGLQSPMQNSEQKRSVLAAPPGGWSGRSGEFKRVITLHLRVFQRGNLLT